MSGAEALALALDDDHFHAVVLPCLVKAGVHLAHHFRGLGVGAFRPIEHDAGSRAVTLVPDDAEILAVGGYFGHNCLVFRSIINC
ncbi:MAG: hypothetical protein QOF15_2926 [Mycobacterium sp.]|jgi:hypothetical protein|nr:hypothetical protein [Mycobacterium sp.]